MADVTKNIDDSRYEIRLDGELAGFQDYEVRPAGVVALTHTEVDDTFSGQGLAGDLTRFALDDIRSEGYKVDAVCPYVASWIEKNPGYGDLVAEDAPGRREAQQVHAENATNTMEDVTGISPDADRRL